MKKFFSLSAAFALAMVASQAPAADLPAKVPVPNSGLWSGIYFGVNGAGAKLSSAFSTTSDLPISGTGNVHPSGAMAGLTLGAGFWNGNVYLGLEADADYDFSKSNVTCVRTAIPVQDVILLDSGNCRVKSGFLFTERVLLGATLGGITNAAVVRGATAPTNWPVPVSAPTSIYAATIMPFATAGIAERRLEACIDPIGCNKQWLVGWTVGGGLKLPVSTNMSIGLTYLYIDWNKHFNPAGPKVFLDIFKAGSEQLIKLNLDYHL
jgi:opacity protein-like surface antigen